MPLVMQAVLTGDVVLPSGISLYMGISEREFLEKIKDGDRVLLWVCTLLDDFVQSCSLNGVLSQIAQTWHNKSRTASYRAVIR
jgi:bifunctional DNA-binding transcriptional regulator/antitoxin component of YhaV-PrlF toxin-antitoxin module